ncbi:MAG TPA: response regulator [Burkholderiaceae bacterium]|nr:response regulator [Burkholderiaceae bacterium]
MANILVVDDEIGIRELLSEILADEGHAVLTAENAAAARAARGREEVDLVLLDIWMPDTDGVTLLKEWASSGQLTMPVIMMSGHATIDTAVEATRFGALEFLEKPIAMTRLLTAVRSGLERGRAMRNVRTAAPVALAALESAPSAPPASDAGGARAVKHTESAEPSEHNGVALDQPLRDARDQFERVYFEYHLARESFSMTRVADRAGLERTHLYRKLKQLGIELSRGARRTERIADEAPAVSESPVARSEPPVYSKRRDEYDD